MKLLIDECISILYPYSVGHFLKKQFTHPQEVTEVLHSGISDQKILKYAMKTKSTIAIMDRKFVVQILRCDKKVVCVLHYGTMIKMEKIGKLVEPTHQLTTCLLQNDKIILP